MCSGSPFLSIVSIHLADASVAETVRRKRPNPSEVAGLRSVRKWIASPFGGGHVPTPQPSRGGIVAFWDDAEALDDFLEWHPLADQLNSGWMVRLQPLQASGSWPGLTIDLPPDVAAEHTGPTVVMTIGNARLRRFPGLQRHTTQIERQVMDAPGHMWGSAFAGPPKLLSTLSIWESPEAMTSFARNGAHRSGVFASVPKDRPIGQPPFAEGTNFFSEAAFIRLRPFAATGHLSGRNAMPAFDFPAGPLRATNGEAQGRAHGL